jgi:hypothetical protein
LETTNPDDNKDVEHMTPEDDIKCHKGSYLPGTNIFAPYIPLLHTPLPSGDTMTIPLVKSKYSVVSVIDKKEEEFNPGYVYSPYKLVLRTEPDPEYDKFMKKYYKQHEVCPRCGATEHTSILIGYILNMDKKEDYKKEDYKDKNNCECSNCGYKNIVHDRISVYDFKRKDFCCKYPIVIANYDPSIDYVFHIKNGDYDPIISSIAVSNTIKLYNESFPGVTYLKYENLERDWYDLLELSKLLND